MVANDVHVELYRVESKADIADGPSRLQTASTVRRIMAALDAQEVQPVYPQWIRDLWAF